MVEIFLKSPNVTYHSKVQRTALIFWGEGFQRVKIAPCQAKMFKIISSWAKIYQVKKSHLPFSLNLGVDCKKLPICDDTEVDDSLDIGALG